MELEGDQKILEEHDRLSLSCLAGVDEPSLWSVPKDSLRLTSMLGRARGLRLRERRCTISSELAQVSPAPCGLFSDFLAPSSEGSSGLLGDLLLLSLEPVIDEVTLVKLKSDETDDMDTDLAKPL